MRLKLKTQREIVAQVKKEAEKMGCTIEVARGTKHAKVLITAPNGQHRSFTIAGSPSDGRSIANAKAQATRLMRKMIEGGDDDPC